MDKNLKEQFATYDSYTPVTLKQDQSHQSWCELEDPKQGYNNAEFRKPSLNSVCEKTNDKVIVKLQNL